MNAALNEGNGPEATALIADDEPLLRERLAALLNRLWPGLRIVAQARNGREAIERFDEHQPDVAFLDIHMPGLNGIEAGRALARRTQLVFVTAYEQYAVQAFEQGAIDYVLKPFDEARLADTVQRLRERVAAAAPAPALPDEVIEALAQRLRQAPAAAPAPWLQWIKASVGNATRLIPVQDVHFLRSDEKYTLVAWSDGDALIRRSIRELADELDPAHFAQIHRSTIVNLHEVARVVRGDTDSARLHLKRRSEVLTVSRSYLHLFKQM
jgi:DNA-binding LytR/AlgR family response regulator